MVVATTNKRTLARIGCINNNLWQHHTVEEPGGEIEWLDRRELAAWVRVAALLEVLPNALDGQLRRDAELTLFEYFVLTMLSEAADSTLRMSELAAQTGATPPRLSHVVRRLEGRGLVARTPDPADGRATRAALTETGRDTMRRAAPGHVVAVRKHVVDALTREQLGQLTQIADALLSRLDETGSMSAMYHRYD